MGSDDENPRRWRAVSTTYDRVALVFEEWLPAALIFCMALGVTVSVVARYVFNQPILGIPELATNAMIWLVFIGAAAVTHRGLHIAIDFITDAMSPRWQAAIAVIAGACTLAVIGILFYWSWDLAAGTHRVLPMTGISAMWSWISLPIGALLMALREIAQMVAASRGLLSGDYEHPASSFADEFPDESQFVTEEL